MDSIMDFFYSWAGMGTLGLIAVVLLIVLLVLRNRRTDD
jgi:hypothetical protein